MQITNQKPERIHHENIVSIQNLNLIRQNCYLIDELNKYKSIINQKSDRQKNSECDCSNQLFEFFKFFKIHFANFQKSIENLGKTVDSSQSKIPNLFATQIKSLVEMIELFEKGTLEKEGIINFNKQLNSDYLENLLAIIQEIISSKKEQTLKSTVDYESLFKLVHREIEIMNDKTSDFQILKYKNEQLELKVIELKSKISTLNWKNHILEKRIPFGFNLLLQQSPDSIPEFLNAPDYYCYCGGKTLLDWSKSPETQEKVNNIQKKFNCFFNSIKNYLIVTDQSASKQSDKPREIFKNLSEGIQVETHGKDIEMLGQMIKEAKDTESDSTLKKQIESQHTHSESPSFQVISSIKESVLSNQIKELQNSNQTLIELFESKRVDKIAGVKNFTRTNLFRRISEENKKNLDYIKDLERRIDEFSLILSEIEVMRRKETFNLKEKTLNDREKLLEEISQLKFLNSELNTKHELLLVPTDPKNTHSKLNNKENSEMHYDNNVLLQKIYQAIKNVIFKQNETLQSKSKIIQEFEFKLESLKTPLDIERLIMNAEFRHTTHAQVFAQIRQVAPQSLDEGLTELERYIKTREDKIKTMARDLKQLTKDLKDEKTNSFSLLNEISNSCTTYEKLKAAYDNTKSELTNSVESFNFIYKEKQTEKVNYDKKITDLENHLQFLNEKNIVKSNKFEILTKELKEMDHSAKNQTSKIKECLQIIETLIQQKNDLTEKIIIAQGEKELFEKRVSAVELSQSKVTKELAESISENAKSKSIQTQLLEILENKKLLPKFEEFGFEKEEELGSQNRSHYFLRLLENEELRKMSSCSVCQIRKRDRVISTCGHTFCEVCIKQHMKTRSHVCPSCMKKISKYDVVGLYFQ